jgi:hypothetical protein
MLLATGFPQWITIRFELGPGAVAGRWLWKNFGSVMAAGKHGKPEGSYGVFSPCAFFCIQPRHQCPGWKNINWTLSQGSESSEPQPDG